MSTDYPRTEEERLRAYEARMARRLSSPETEDNQPGSGKPHRNGSLGRSLLIVIALAAAVALIWFLVTQVTGTNKENANTTPPPPALITVTIPEGLSRHEADKLIDRSHKLTGNYMAASKDSTNLNPRRYKAPKDVSTLEGFLFPATYELEQGASVDALVKAQAKAFKQNFAKVDLGYAKSRNLTPYDILTIASMIEREVSNPQERKLVAAVIYNRLREGMPLGIDATTRYATKNWTKPITQADLESNSAYNTRNQTGLPPTPIGNPGLSSIKAAAKPAKVSYLYYVVKPGTCDKHAFSSTEQKFQQDVQNYNEARQKAGGKSPTKC